MNKILNPFFVSTILLLFLPKIITQTVKNVIIPGNNQINLANLSSNYISNLNNKELSQNESVYINNGSNIQDDLNIIIVLSQNFKSELQELKISSYQNVNIMGLNMDTDQIITMNSEFIFEKLVNLEFTNISALKLENFQIILKMPNIIIDQIQKLDVLNLKIQENIEESENFHVGYIFYIKETNNINITDGEFYNTVGGQLLHFKQCVNISINNCIFQNNISNQYHNGGAIGFEDSPTGTNIHNILINNSKFINNQCDADFGGGAIFLQYINGVTIENCVFQGNVAMHDGAAINADSTDDFIINNSRIIKNVAEQGYGTLNFISCTQIQINDSFIQENEIKEGGGGIRLITSSNLEIINTSISKNKSMNGGGLLLTTSTNVFIQDSQINQNNAIDSGGGLNLLKINNIVLENVEVSDNYGYFAGAIKQVSLLQYNYTNTLFQNNKSIKDSGAIKEQSGVNGIMFNTKFLNNTSETTFGGAIYLQNTNYLDLYNVDISNNKCNINGGGIYMESSDYINMTNVLFYKNEATINLGGSICSIGTQHITLDNCTFQEGLAYKSGGISFKSAKIDINISNSKFFDNFSQSIGGGMDFETSMISIENCEFYNNYAEDGGGAVHISKSTWINFTDCYFANNTSVLGGGIKVINGMEATFTNCNIFQNNALEQGGGFYFNNMDKLFIIDSIIENNQCLTQGGGIHTVNVNTVDILNSNITDNFVNTEERQNSIGGGIYFTNTVNLIVKNSQISKNRAIVKGGGAFITKVQNTIFENNIIESNYVEFDRKKTRQDKEYGYFISKGGGVYYKPDLLKDQDGNDLLQSLSFIQNKFVNNSASSGSSIVIYHEDAGQFQLESFNGNIMQKEEADIGFIRYFGNSASTYDSLLRSIDTSDPGNKLHVYEEQQYVSFYIENERRFNEKTFEFELCLAGTSMKEGGSTFCDKCNDFGICEGGYKFNYPKPQYWRLSKEEWDYYYCTTDPSLCLGNDECKQGYKGMLCEECDYIGGYSRTSTGTCDICPSGGLIVLLMAVVFILYIALILSTSGKVQLKVQQGIMKKYLAIMWGKLITFTNQSSPITKIVIMHMQILYLIKPFNIEFPSLIQGFSTSLANPGTSIALPTICMNPVETEKQEFSIRFDQSILSLLFSFVIWITLMSITILSYFKRDFKKIKWGQLRTQLISISIVFFITQQVGLLEENLKFLVCRKIGNQSFTIVDTHVDCSSDYYQNSIFPTNLISLIVLLFIIPAFMFYKIHTKRNFQEDYNVQLTYGYLFIEFKKKCYYWEFLTMLQKGLIIVISIQFVEEFIFKSFLSILVIMTYSLSSFWVQPFIYVQLNRITQISSLCQVVTLFSSIILFGLQDQDKLGFLQIICIFAILTSNLVFLIYALKMVVPYMGTSVKVMIIDKQQKLPKVWIVNRLSQYNEKRKKGKQRWAKVAKIVKEYLEIMKLQQFKKFNKTIIFYNTQNKVMIDDLKNGKYQKVNNILFQKSEQKILSEKNYDVQEICNYFESKQIMGENFQNHVIKHISENIITESASLQSPRLKVDSNGNIFYPESACSPRKLNNSTHYQIEEIQKNNDFSSVYNNHNQSFFQNQSQLGLNSRSGSQSVHQKFDQLSVNRKPNQSHAVLRYQNNSMSNFNQDIFNNQDQLNVSNVAKQSKNQIKSSELEEIGTQDENVDKSNQDTQQKSENDSNQNKQLYVNKHIQNVIEDDINFEGESLYSCTINRSPVRGASPSKHMLYKQGSQFDLSSVRNKNGDIFFNDNISTQRDKNMSQYNSNINTDRGLNK